MRKIKTNKKDIDRKTRQIGRTLDELIEVHLKLHDRDKTIEVAKKLLALKPNVAYPVEKLTSVCIDLNEYDTAKAGSDYMEKHFPPSGYRVFLKARVCDIKQDYGGCIKYAEEALKIPGNDLLTQMMIHNILGHAYRYVADAEMSLYHYEMSATKDISVGKGTDRYPYLYGIKCDDYSNFLFSLHNLNVSREKIFDGVEHYNDIFADLKPFEHSPATHPRHDKIRIGYISPDIRRHVVAFFSYAFYKSYDKSKFEVYCYPKCPEDNVSTEFKAGVDGWKNILYDQPEVAAKKIKDDEIDILVDLSGHTANNCLRVMAYKPAPVQISAIGWFNSTGLKTIDYFLCDKFTDPEGLNEQFFTEKILRLQHSHFCYMWHDAPIEIQPAPCLKNGYVTFVSFNNFIKVTDEMLKIWAAILERVPNSRLYVKGKAFRSQYGIDFAVKRMKAAGIPIERVRMEADEMLYLVKYAETDIALDTFPYPGGGTTCDALFMGIPVLTLVGKRHNGRFGYSLLHNMELDELCAFSEQEYIDKAVELANDFDRINDYHLTIRRRMSQSPVMNDSIYMSELEAAYEKIYNAWINGESLPDFHDEEPPITPDDAEKFYERALEYIKAEPQFYDSIIKNVVNVKRADYWLEQAAKASVEHRAEIHLLLSHTKQLLKNYVLAYDRIKVVEECLPSSEPPPVVFQSDEPMIEKKQYPREFLKRYHRRRAKLAMVNSNPHDGVAHYNRAVDLADNAAERAEIFSAAISNLHYLNVSSDELIVNHFRYQNIFDEIKPFDTFHDTSAVLRGERRMRVGYLLPHFAVNSMFALTCGMLVGANKERVEVFAYKWLAGDNFYANLLKNSPLEHFVDVGGHSTEEIVNRIRADQIDILVDLGGHGEFCAYPIMAYKPAPIQITGIGARSTSGLKTIDYFLTDEIADPRGAHDKYFVEKLLYLPSQFCYISRSDVAAPEDAPCLKNGYVTFGSFNDYQSITDEILGVWKEILRRIPTARLIMRAKEFESDAMIDAAYKRLKALGLNMSAILFLPATNDHMQVLRRLDIALSTFPQTDAAMTMDALYMGVPVVSIYSDRRDTRLAYDLLSHVGLGELAVTTAQDYLVRAMGLAQSTDTLNALHRNLRAMVKKATSLDPNNYNNVLERQYFQLIANGAR